MNGQILKGHLDYLILAAVEPEPAHGYLIIQALRLRSGGKIDLPEGSVYPALHRLAKSGLLADRWITHAGRRRRVYHLTRAGRRSLAAHRRQWTEFAKALSAALEPA